MAQLNGTFDATQIEPDNDQLPAGLYIAQIIKSEIKTNKNGTGQNLSLEMHITDGQFKGWRIWEQLNLWHNNPKASQIAQGKLSSIARAVGVLQFNDTQALHNLNLQVRVAIDQTTGKAEAKGYKAIETQGHQPSPGRSFAEQQQPHNSNFNPDGTPKTPQQMLNQQGKL